MKRLLLLSLFISPFFAAIGQVKSGPMVGYSTMREVLLWVQTEKAVEVYFKYHEIGGDKISFTTEKVMSSKADAFIVKLIADEVLPSKKYTYELFVDGKEIEFSHPLAFQTQSLWQYRTDPPEFKFAVGSCTYTNEERFDRPGRPYGGGNSIFTSIYNDKPDFMLWTGDNIYLREPDWNSRTGIFHRYAEFKKIPELQPLWANTHHYAILDDHDFGPNDSDRSFWNKDITLDAFKKNWANPNYIFEDEATTGTFFWQDCQFFLMDDRYFRAPNNLKDESKDYYGKKQEDWLIDALASSNAPFKFIVTGGQIINPVAVFENMSTFPEARKRLLRRIEENDISGVLFITGDRHSTVLQKLDREGNYPLYDVTISPLTSGVATPTDEEMKSSPIIAGTLVKENNYAIMEVSGKRTDRNLKIDVMNKEGNLLWTYNIKANDLRSMGD
ncbi:MAG: alkaline phosphatase family protein [Spirosomaceae bacterium]|nr:alkaline phosphatase family protein [Spirosomataceae bacterium]